MTYYDNTKKHRIEWAGRGWYYSRSDGSDYTVTAKLPDGVSPESWDYGTPRHYEQVPQDLFPEGPY